jgi:hypothetical protein
MGSDPKDNGAETMMVDLHLPETVAGYAYPVCPHCDKQYGTEVANVGPVECGQCGKWFEVTTQIVYHSEQKLDYAGARTDAPEKFRRKSAGGKSKISGKPRIKRRAK